MVGIKEVSFSGITKIEVNSKVLNLWLKRQTDGFLVNWKGYEGDLKIYPPEVSKMFEFIPTKRMLVSDQSVLAPMPGLLVSIDVIKVD